MLNLPGRGPSNTLRPFLAASLASLLWAPAALAADLTGHWRSASNGKSEIVQTGASVAMDGCEGTIDGSNVELTCPDQGGFSPTYSLVLSVDELTLSGELHTFKCAFSFCMFVDIPVVLERCECFDGNTANGDGCDLMCTVEECYECTGDPSTCTPVADTTACEDPSVCVSGGTCSAGVCEGGLETAQCLDLSGTWLRGRRGTSGLWEGMEQSRSEFVQDADGSLTVFTLPSGYEERSGTFDGLTRALHLDGTGAFPTCGQTATDGTATADGNRFVATGGYLAATPHGCFGYAPYDEVGVRCAPAALEPPDGCSVDSCERCEGDVCEPVPDGIPCASSDSCAVVSTCEAGQCVTELSMLCPTCSACDGAGGCKVGPRTDCRDAATKLLIKSSDSARSSLRFDWKNGGLLEALDIGRPEDSSEVAICLFDESVTEPALLFSLSTFENEDWSTDSNGGMHFRSRTDVISAVDLRVGDSAKVSLKTATGTPGLPVPELSTPLRAQLQIKDGTCFEGLYEGEDVRRNANGIFKGKSTP